METRAAAKRRRPDTRRAARAWTTGRRATKLTTDSVSALCDAARRNQLDTAAMLLDDGADVDGRDRRGSTALHLAARAGHAAMVDMLLDNGADTTATDEGRNTAVHLAAAGGHNGILCTLLRRGASLGCRSACGGPLHCAALNGHA